MPQLAILFAIPSLGEWVSASIHFHSLCPPILCSQVICFAMSPSIPPSLCLWPQTPLSPTLATPLSLLAFYLHSMSPGLAGCPAPFSVFFLSDSLSFLQAPRHTPMSSLFLSALLSCQFSQWKPEGLQGMWLKFSAMLLIYENPGWYPAWGFITITFSQNPLAHCNIDGYWTSRLPFIICFPLW